MLTFCIFVPQSQKKLRFLKNFKNKTFFFFFFKFTSYKTNFVYSLNKFVLKHINYLIKKYSKNHITNDSLNIVLKNLFFKNITFSNMRTLKRKRFLSKGRSTQILKRNTKINFLISSVFETKSNLKLLNKNNKITY